MEQTPATEEHALLGLPFDHYSRYALTRRIVAVLREATGVNTFRVLDVGGHSSPLKHFIPADYVALLDVEPVGSLTSIDLRCDEYFQGSGAALPFADGAFDIVAAHDTLEHVPEPYRHAFLEEIHRVARMFVLLSGPVADPDVSRAEARLDSFVKTALGWEQPFLAEHLALGLPRMDDIEAFLGSRRHLWARVPSGNLVRWLSTQTLRHYFASLPDTDALREEIDRSYNEMYADSDNEGVCYRQAYVIAKTGEEGALQRIRDAFPPLTTASAATDLDALEGYIGALESHAIDMRGHLSHLHERVFRGEKDSYELRGTLEEVAGKLGDTEAQSRERLRMLEERDAELHEALVEREAIENTTGYRLLERYRSSTRSLFPPGSVQAKPYRAVKKLAKSLFGGKR